MKKTLNIRKLIFYGLLIIILLLPLWMYLFWLLSKEKKINILILDKTVLNEKVQEHISLNWVLTNNKYINGSGKLFDKYIDYFGFFPKEGFNYEIKDFNNLNDSILSYFASNYDMAYYSDLYGIYYIEWFEKNIKNYQKFTFDRGKIAELERSQKIYGGLTQKELDFLIIMKNSKKLIITEFNTIGSPTPETIRNQFQDTFHLKWTGWVGRYFSSLDTNKNKELPKWLKRNYVLQHDSTWPFTKSGIAFVRNDDWIEILENETHLNVEIPYINTNISYQEKFNLPSTMKYPFWFDIVSSDTTNNIVSEYLISPNQKGILLMQKYNIPMKFPAVIEHDNNDYLFYYLAGDYCDNPITMRTSYFKGIEFFSWLLYENSIEERYSFFWNYYRPLIDKIIENYYNKKNMVKE